MAIASSNSVALLLNAEGTWGETPTSVAMQQLRFTGESLVYGKKTVQSETIRSDRMRDQIALVGFETQGDINYEFAAFDYDPFMEGALSGTWVGATTKTATTIAFTSTAITDSGNSFGSVPVNGYVWVSGSSNKALNRRYRVTASATGSLTVTPAPAATAVAGDTITLSFSGINVTTAASTLIVAVTGTSKTITFSGSTGFNPTTATNFSAGQFIRLAGFANAGNNGVKRIASVTATTITLVDTMVDEAVANATVLNFSGRSLRNSTVQRSFHLQKGFTDIGQYISFRGMRVNTFSLDTTAQEIIKGTTSFMGSKVLKQTATWATSQISTNTSPVMTGSAHVGTIYQNGSAIQAGIKQIQLEVNNNLRMTDTIGTLYPYAIGYGFQDVTGSIEVYFEDASLYDQLINHTATELSWATTDDQGNAYQITIPQILFTEGFPQAGSGNEDITIPLSFNAIRSATYNCQIQIDLLPSLV